MTADTQTISAWLLEQIAADETVVRAATPGPWRTFADAEGGVWAREGYGMAATGCGQGNADHIARHDPAHVLAVCEAHRRIVALHAPDDEGFHICHDSLADDSDCGELRALAAIYAERDGFREEWAL